MLRSLCRPLVYTVSVLLPAAYLIGLIFTLKTHTHIYDIHVSDAHCHGATPNTHTLTPPNTHSIQCLMFKAVFTLWELYLLIDALLRLIRENLDKT